VPHRCQRPRTVQNAKYVRGRTSVQPSHGVTEKARPGFRPYCVSMGVHACQRAVPYCRHHNGRGGGAAQLSPAANWRTTERESRAQVLRGRPDPRRAHRALLTSTALQRGSPRHAAIVCGQWYRGRDGLRSRRLIALYSGGKAKCLLAFRPSRARRWRTDENGHFENSSRPRRDKPGCPLARSYGCYFGPP